MAEQTKINMLEQITELQLKYRTGTMVKVQLCYNVVDLPLQ
jgi:hypothetical protein